MISIGKQLDTTLKMIEFVQTCLNKHIKKIMFSGNRNKHNMSLTAFLDDNSFIGFYNNFFCDDEYEYNDLETCLNKINNLTEIEISDFDWDINIIFFTKIINSKKIETLVIRKTNVNLGELLCALQKNESLTTIIIDGKNTDIIEIDYLDEILQYLQLKKELKHLELSHCLITDEINPLCRVLKQNKNLRSLNITTIDPISKSNISEISKLAQKNYFLQQIVCNITIGYLELKSEIADHLNKNIRTVQQIIQIKTCMMILRNIKGCIVSIVPRRLLIHLLSFVDIPPITQIIKYD